MYVVPVEYPWHLRTHYNDDDESDDDDEGEGEGMGGGMYGVGGYVCVGVCT